MTSWLVETDADYVERGLYSCSFGLLLILYLLISFYPWYVRKEVFNREFLRQFIDEHKLATKEEEPPKLGYPDMGNGRYAEKLGYAAWFKFNCAQRIHQEFMEELPVLLLCMGISGLYHKLIAAILGFAYFVFIILYALLTMRSANKRIISFVLGIPAFFGLIGLSFASVFQAYIEATSWNV